MADSFTTTTTRDELVYDLDPVHLGEPVAEVIRAQVQAGIRGITEMSRDGRHRLFNKTGHLADGITVERDGDGFAISAPSDRLADDAVVARLVELVPVIADPTGTAEVQRAIEKTLGVMIRRG